MKALRCFLLALGLLHFGCEAGGADTNGVINAWLGAQKGLRTWTADFTQTRKLKTLTQPLVAPGHLWFAIPNRFRWELGVPAKTIAIRENDQMYVIYPGLKRAERYPLGPRAPGEWREAIALLEAGFPHDRKELDQRFQILALEESNGAWEITLQPSSAFARRMMSEIHVGLNTNDFTLRSTELVFIDGSRMRTDFRNGRINSGFDEAILEWKPTPDFKVTEPLSQ